MQVCEHFPAYAGVNPRSWQRLTARKNSPRMRGGHPFARVALRASLFTPHARGSTQQRQFSLFPCNGILPACAGVNLVLDNGGAHDQNSPRMRGGQPAEQSAQFCIGNSPRTRGGQPSFMATLDRPEEFSPHARGSTQQRQFSLFPCNGILPACAGVNLVLDNGGAHDQNSPRMRGGQPHVQVQWLYDDAFTPHARGSIRRTIGTVLVLVILPARAGGQPGTGAKIHKIEKFSPHARGSTRFLHEEARRSTILPACAGVNPTSPVLSKGISDSPRMCGGQPDLVIDAYTTLNFSPAYAGM